MYNKELLIKITEGIYESSLQNKLTLVYKEELKFLNWILSSNKELLDYLKSPFINYDEKEKMIDKLFENLLVNEMLIFLKYLVNKRLIFYIHDIYKEFIRLSDIDENIVTGIIYTPFNIDDARHKKIEDVMSKKLNKKVILKEQIETSLICGIRIMINENIYEYSINSRLEDIKTNLINDINRGENNA